MVIKRVICDGKGGKMGRLIGIECGGKGGYNAAVKVMKCSIQY